MCRIPRLNFLRFASNVFDRFAGHIKNCSSGDELKLLTSNGLLKVSSRVFLSSRRRLYLIRKSAVVLFCRYMRYGEKEYWPEL